MTTTIMGGTGIESVNQSVRLRTPQAEELYEYRCEAGHVRTSANITVTGFCRQCAATTHKRSRWVRHEVAKPQEQLESVADFYLAHYEAEQKRRDDAEQVKLDRQRQRESQERKTRDAQSAAFDLMDASKEEQSVVIKRLAGRNCSACEYVAELRRLREAQAT